MHSNMKQNKRSLYIGLFVNVCLFFPLQSLCRMQRTWKSKTLEVNSFELHQLNLRALEHRNNFIFNLQESTWE